MKMILRWAQRFVMAYGIIMLATFFMCLFFNPTSQLAVVPFFGRCIVLTLVCMATLIVYYTKGELSVRAWWFRTILHTCLLEITLLLLTHYWHFWYGPLDAAIYGSFILGAKILWHIVDFGQSMRIAAEVNEQLHRRRMETVEERREKMRKRH